MFGHASDQYRQKQKMHVHAVEFKVLAPSQFKLLSVWLDYGTNDHITITERTQCPVAFCYYMCQ